MKYLPVIFLIAAIVCGVWTYNVGGADGSVFALILCSVLAIGIGLVNYKRTGKVLTNDAGGH